MLHTGYGSKRVFDEVKRLFPSATVGRYDTDSKNNDSYAEDILVGTTTLATGLDLPRVRSVLITNADNLLYKPDYRSAERTYQLVHQLSGRTSRQGGYGNIVIQTTIPDSYIYKTLIGDNIDEFYSDEIIDRKKNNFPPFRYMAKVWVSRKTRAGVIKSIKNGLSKINNNNITIFGPAPAFREQQFGLYTWQAILSSTNRAQLNQVIKLLPTDWKHQLDPDNIL